MSNATIIEDGWRHIVKDQDGFCCETHRGLFRAIYFAGAMNAMAAATNWQPGLESSQIKPARLNAVCEELTLETYKAEREAGGAGHA